VDVRQRAEGPHQAEIRLEITDQCWNTRPTSAGRRGDRFASADGLLFTNQHVGRGQVTKLDAPADP
jgi:hypothetical protein